MISPIPVFKKALLFIVLPIMLFPLIENAMAKSESNESRSNNYKITSFKKNNALQIPPLPNLGQFKDDAMTWLPTSSSPHPTSSSPISNVKNAAQPHSD